MVLSGRLDNQLYAIEAGLRGQSPAERASVRQEQSRPIVDSLHALLEAKLTQTSRKSALFAGSDEGGQHWAVIASLIETAKLNDIGPQAWLASTLARLAAGYPASELDSLMPWQDAGHVA